MSKTSKNAAAYGNHIRQIRTSLGETRQQFGQRFLASPRTVENWEIGHREPPPLVKQAIVAMSKFYGIKLDPDVMQANTRREPAGLFPHYSLREMDELKSNADKVTAKAIRTGHLQRQPCEVCGTDESVEAHHDDYAKPLDVQWLCRHHHVRKHAESRAKSNSTSQVKQGSAQRKDYGAKTPTNAHHSLVKSVTVAIAEAMNAENITEAQLSAMVGLSRQTINLNFAGGFRTFRTIAVVSDAIGYDVQVRLVKRKPEISNGK